MIKNIVTGLLLIFLATSVATAQDADETAAWEAAQKSTTSEEVFAFIEQYPSSVYAKDAKSLMIDLLWTELAEESPQQATQTSEPAAESAPVFFSQPLTEGSADVVGRSLKQLIASSPAFPPIEGLPETYWKDQTCSNCHEWEKANLCTQANSYLSDAGAENLIKKHPFGGAFKLNLRVWAKGGCE
jgi:hypothetical protein